MSLLALVQANLATAVARSPRMPARRLPRRAVAMGAAGPLAATGHDARWCSRRRSDWIWRAAARLLPSLVLLVAPVAPLLGVAAVWSAGLDPAHELVVASPRAGLYMVLRRTLAVLVVVIPALTVAGWLAGASPARWLLPCLAFTAGALALGELIGLRWAAGGLALAWTAGVIAPSVLAARTSAAVGTGQSAVLGRADRRDRGRAGAAPRRVHRASEESDRWFVR